MARVSMYLKERLSPMGLTDKEIAQVEMVLSASKAGKEVIVVDNKETSPRKALCAVFYGEKEHEVTIPKKARTLSQETLDKRYQEQLKKLKVKYKQGE